MRRLGVDYKDRRLIGNLYMGQKITVRIEEKDSDPGIIGIEEQDRGVRSGAFRGARCDAPPFLAWPWKFFTGDFIWKSAFFAFFQQISEKWQICGFYWTFKSKKCFSFRGASPPDLPTRGSAPGPRWGIRPQTSVVGSRSARSPCPLCQILNTPLDVRYLLFYSTSISRKYWMKLLSM